MAKAIEAILLRDKLRFTADHVRRFKARHSESL